MIYRHQGTLDYLVTAYSGGWCFSPKNGIEQLKSGQTAPPGIFRVSRSIAYKELKYKKHPGLVAMRASQLVADLREDLQKAFLQLKDAVYEDYVRTDREGPPGGHFYYTVHSGPTCEVHADRPLNQTHPTTHLEIQVQATLLWSPTQLGPPCPQENLETFSFERGDPLPNWIGRFPAEGEHPLAFLENYMSVHMSPLAQDILLGA